VPAVRFTVEQVGMAAQAGANTRQRWIAPHQLLRTCSRNACRAREPICSKLGNTEKKRQ
jgi:hypothetical protein